MGNNPYKLEGLMQSWPDRMKDNTINFSYLQPGKYSLLVRSRDTFGRIQTCDPFDFRISPPYWNPLVLCH